MPSTCDQATVERVLRLLRRNMKWLWIELSGKGDDLFFGHRQTPQFDTIPDLEILK